jgi:integrase
MGLGTHAGRSTAITVLYAEEGLDLADIARHVGHAAPATTAGYVRHLGRRPSATAEAASRLLDPTGFDRDEAGTGVRPRSHD